MTELFLVLLAEIILVVIKLLLVKWFHQVTDIEHPVVQSIFESDFGSPHPSILIRQKIRKLVEPISNYFYCIDYIIYSELSGTRRVPIFRKHKLENSKVEVPFSFVFIIVDTISLVGMIEERSIYRASIRVGIWSFDRDKEDTLKLLQDNMERIKSTFDTVGVRIKDTLDIEDDGNLEWCTSYKQTVYIDMDIEL